MATTPLKTASRALSIATVMLAGFAAWVLGTQDSTTSSSVAPQSETGRSVEFAAVAEPSVIATDLSTKVVGKQPTRRRLDEEIAQPTPKRRTEDDSFFEDEAFEANHAATSSTGQPARQKRIPARIQPELGRLSPDHESAPALNDGDELDSLVEEAIRSPQKSRTTGRSADTLRPADVFAESASSRVESKLVALQQRLDQLAQTQTEQKTDEFQKTIEAIEQIQENKTAETIQQILKQLREAPQNGNAAPNSTDPKPGSPKSLDPPDTAEQETSNSDKPADDQKSGFMRFEPSARDSDRFDNIDFDDVDISKALAALGQLSGMNILVGRGVTGRVPAANLQNVSAEEALDAITKSLGYVYEREGNFVYVWAAAESQARKQAARKTVSKVYRPRYVSVKDLQTLVTPMLSKPAGLIAVTNPAEVGLEESKTKVGGNSLAQTDAILVVDYPEVIAQIDEVLLEIDVPPAQVVIEAMILSVKLTDTMKMGVNFALLNGDNKQLVTSGNGSQINTSVGFPNNAPNKTSLLPVAGDFIANSAGLKYGFLYGDLAGFVEALETLAETSVIASPSVRVLNKQKAELIIGQRLGYKTITNNGVQSIENINFLEVGTKLILRPFVSQDGLVRMEIHPERSDGIINGDGLPESRTTEVTSNVMIRDGSTIVVGGLIEEQANQKQDRIPGLGALPVVGNLFKNKSNDTTRTELIVLITPRVIHDPDAECEGDLTRSENERRHQHFRDKLSPINRHNLARVEYERAARYFDEGDAPRAKRHIDESLRHNRTDNDALRLRDQITAAIDDKNWFKKLRRKPPTEYHRVPSAPTSLPGEAIFEQEIPAPVPSPFTPVPPAPAAMP